MTFTQALKKVIRYKNYSKAILFFRPLAYRKMKLAFYLDDSKNIILVPSGTKFVTYASKIILQDWEVVKPEVVLNGK